MTLTHEQLTKQQLEMLQQALEEVDIGVQYMSKDELFELDTLLVSAEDDYLGRTQLVNLAYVNDLSDPESNLMLLQYFTELEPKYTDEQSDMVLQLLNFINIRMPIGHFCTQSNKIYFRYVLADAKTAQDHAMKVIETFFTYVDVLDLFQESIEQILAGTLMFETFKSKF